MILKKARPLYLQVRDELTRHIAGMNPGENRLPSEEELTRQLGVSRSTVREALHDMIREGIVSKRHGKGNFAHPAILRVPYRIDFKPDFRQLLEDPERKLTIRSTPYSRGPASEKMVRRMPEAAGEPVYRWDWEYYLDDTLYIIATEEIPVRFFRQDPVYSQEFSVREFVAACCERDLAYFISWIQAGDRPEIAARFGVSGTILQDWEELYYDIEDYPVCFCEVYFNPSCMEVSILTKL